MSHCLCPAPSFQVSLESFLGSLSHPHPLWFLSLPLSPSQGLSGGFSLALCVCVPVLTVSPSGSLPSDLRIRAQPYHQWAEQEKGTSSGNWLAEYLRSSDVQRCSVGGPSPQSSVPTSRPTRSRPCGWSPSRGPPISAAFYKHLLSFCPTFWATV